MFEQITAKMSKIAAQSVKETFSESIAPIATKIVALSPMIGLLWASASRSKAARTTATVINYYFSQRP